MKERPILMQGWSVRAILADNKTQTRRVIKPQAWSYSNDILGQQVIYARSGPADFGDPTPIKCPYGRVDDLLWVRETWCGAAPGGYDARNDGGEYWYRATDEGRCMGPWSPSIFMPKRAARLWLCITDIRVERVQDINNLDAKAEGIEPTYLRGHSTESLENGYRHAFCTAWDSINAKRGYSWKSNPWVWVVEFERKNNV